MQLNKSIAYHIGYRFLFFLFLNFSLNLFGLWFSKLVLKENFIYLESIQNEFIIPIVIQSIIYVICYGLAYILLKNKEISWISVGVFQFIILHIAFVSGLKFSGGIHFETTISHVGLRFLSYNGQYLVDFIFTNRTLTGNFENGLFKPTSISFFYLSWVFVVSLYFFIISWLNEQIVKLFCTPKYFEAVNNEQINDI